MPPFINRSDDDNMAVEVKLQKQILQQLEREVESLSEGLEKANREIFSMKEKNATQNGRDTALGFIIGAIFFATLQFVIPRVFETSNMSSCEMIIARSLYKGANKLFL